MKYVKEFVSGAVESIVQFALIIVYSAFCGAGLAYGALVGLNVYAALHGA